ncbi:hypothetical protein ACEPAI_1117 [Sanghuangporus weigelae]
MLHIRTISRSRELVCAMENVTSSYSVIKALKGPEDLPASGGPLKIEIARKAWESNNIHFPSKDEVLAEWILTSFIKHGKDAGASGAIILNPDYWTLLGDILNMNSPSQSARQSRTWLSGLCTRVSILNIVILFFKCASLAEPAHLQNALEPFARSIQVIWPQAATRMSLDALTDCLGSMLQYVASESALINHLAPVCLLITRTFKQAVGNTTGKKKAFSWFMDQSFLRWTRVVCLDSLIPIAMSRETKLLISEIYQAGTDVFFCLDSLKNSSDPLDTIFTDPKYSLSNMQTSQYRIVPMLFRAYVQELRKHRYIVFGSGSSQTQEHTVHNKLRDAGMRAFGVCYRALRERGDVLEVWKNILALVEALEEANLVGYGLTEKTDVLNDIAGSAITSLLEIQDERIDRLETALRILCAVSCIDFDFLSPLLPDVLAVLLTMNPSVYPSTQTLLHIVLDFHSNTRTMPSYLTLVLKALSDYNTPRMASTVPQTHRLCTSGALLSLAHLEELSRSIRSFLTPGQTEAAVDSSLSALRNAWTDYSERADTGCFAMEPEKVEYEALRYSLVARAVAVILPSLPFSSLSEPALASVLESVSSTWSIALSEAARAAFSGSSPSSNGWAAQCVSAATLRVRHAVLMCPALCASGLSSPSIVTGKDTAECIQSIATIPEFIIELLRAFFDADFVGASPEERETVINSLIAYLDNNLVVSGHEHLGAELAWNGSSSSLNPVDSESRKRGALAVCHLLFDRWLPIIDEIASQKQLEQISRLLLVRADPSDGSYTEPNQICFMWLLNRVLQSAAFWELPNIRDAVISNIDSVTQFAKWDVFSDLLKQVRAPNETKSSSVDSLEAWMTEQVQSVLAAFRLLLRAPREYLPRDARLVFVRRALVSDLAISRHERESAKDSSVLPRITKASIRSWITSVSDSCDITDIISIHLLAYVEYLIIESDNLENDIRTVTLDLLSVIFRQAVRSAAQNKSDQFISLCTLIQGQTSNMSEQARLRFIEILVTECPDAKKLSTSCINAVNELCSDMQTKYSGILSTTVVSMPEISYAHVLVVHLWRNCVMLQKWLNKKGSSTFGFQLVQRIVPADRYPSSNEEVKSYCTQILLLLLEELDSLNTEEREKHVSSTIAAYILFVGRLQLIDQFECDAALGRTFKTLSADEFGHVLSLLREALEKGLATNAETRATVHLFSTLIGDAPEGTMKVTQEHFEACLSIFCGDSKCAGGDAELMMEVLGFIGKMCSEKHAYLRHSALGPIWLLLAKILTGSTTHVQETCPGIVHSITSIAGSLIRLRRDLITSTLPHLGMVLSSLIRSLRAPRAQLGARQRTQVSDTLPWWVSPSAPLGVAEGRAVARLLTTLQAKTIPRTFTSRDKSKEKERFAESLLGAFSKHAAPVLGTYINMLVDPLVTIDSSIREALAPGLYALCEAMGEHGRDALMVSGCDAAGKTVFKALWKDYDKQRYVGKG